MENEGEDAFDVMMGICGAGCVLVCRDTIYGLDQIPEAPIGRTRCPSIQTPHIQDPISSIYFGV